MCRNLWGRKESDTTERLNRTEMKLLSTGIHRVLFFIFLLFFFYFTILYWLCHTCDNPVCETAKETQMYRTVFWTLWEREGDDDFGEWH